MDSLKLKVELNELYNLLEFIEKHYQEDIKTELAVEEIFVNIVNYSNADYIIVNVEYDDYLTMEFIDNGIKFDPTTQTEYKNPKTIEETPIGGLGILLVKNYADELTYNRVNNENHLKIIKKD